MVLAEAPMAAKESVEAADEGAAAEVTVRSKFENALTFQPHLVSDAAGNLSFTFSTSDKLSTYYVALYAHDKGMRNTYLREEMVVSVPVKVAVVEPQFLYVGDTYEVAASVSSNTDKRWPPACPATPTSRFPAGCTCIPILPRNMKAWSRSASSASP